MSADKDKANPSVDAHTGHDDHPAATDIIPENSPQDLVLKLVTIISAVLISGTFAWWWMQPLSESAEGHGAVESH